MVAEYSERFWRALDTLVAEHEMVIDRPAGSRHPRYPAFVYPLDYGYLEGTSSMDGGGIDVWRGSLDEPVVTGMIVTVDALKADSEIKVLLGCTAHEMRTALASHSTGPQAGYLVERPTSESN